MDRADAAATADLDGALATYAALGNPACSCHGLEAFAWWLAVRGEPDRSAGVLAAVRTIREREHHHRAVYESVAFRGAVAMVGDSSAAIAGAGAPAFTDVATGIETARRELGAALDARPTASGPTGFDGGGSA